MDDRELEDGDFDYVEVSARPGGTHMVTNQPHDEEISISDSEQHRDESDTLQGLSIVEQGAGNPETEQTLESALAAKDDTFSGDVNPKRTSSPKQSGQRCATYPSSTLPANDTFVSGYDPKQYEETPVDSSIKALFTYIGRYQPQRRHLETELKPFIPDYIAAVGDVDEFLKPPRPDGEPEVLGLSILDEPSAHQSDPAILRKFARSMMKGTAALAENDDFDAAIHHDDEERNDKIDAWIQSVEKLRDAQAIGEVRGWLGMYVLRQVDCVDGIAPFITCLSYDCCRQVVNLMQFKSSNRFPAIDTLMQAWPEELEPLVRSLHVSSTHVDVDIKTLGEALCNLLDIPVYDDLVESLHWILMLYLELKNNELINPADSNTMGAMENVNFYINAA